METNEASSEEEVPFINQVPTLPIVSNAALPSGTQNAVTVETAATNQPAADHLATQPQDSDISAVHNAPIQSHAKPPVAIPVVCADHASLFAEFPKV